MALGALHYSSKPFPSCSYSLACWGHSRCIHDLACCRECTICCISTISFAPTSESCAQFIGGGRIQSVLGQDSTSHCFQGSLLPQKPCYRKGGDMWGWIVSPAGQSPNSPGQHYSPAFLIAWACFPWGLLAARVPHRFHFSAKCQHAVCTCSPGPGEASPCWLLP